jgi:hypothetical protein
MSCRLAERKLLEDEGYVLIRNEITRREVQMCSVKGVVRGQSKRWYEHV